MSKIGRRPIELGSVQVEIKGNEVQYKGPHATGTYVVADDLSIEVENNALYLKPVEKHKDINRIWGLHRALLANAILGAGKLFERQIKIVGLGYKAVLKGKDLNFSLGYSHKIDFDCPEGVTIDVDKTNQLLTLKSPYKELLGLVCSKIKALRPVEPYKGTGIHYVGEHIRRKAGKAKV